MVATYDGMNAVGSLNASCLAPVETAAAHALGVLRHQFPGFVQLACIAMVLRGFFEIDSRDFPSCSLSCDLYPRPKQLAIHHTLSLIGFHFVVAVWWIKLVGYPFVEIMKI